MGRPGANRAPLRVAVIIGSRISPEWVAWTVRRIARMEECVLLGVVPIAQEHTPRSREISRLYGLYEQLDAFAFGAATALREADPTAITGGRARPGRDEPVDVVVSFVGGDPPRWEGPPPTHGVWTIVPTDNGRPGAALRRFWDVRNGGTSTTAIVARAERGRNVIASVSVPADPLSVTRTRNAAAWASARLVVRTLEKVHRRTRLPAHDSKLDVEDREPSTAALVAHAARTAGRGLAAKGRKAWITEEWFVAVRTRPADGGRGGRLQVLPNPPGRYLADPFPIEVDGRHYLFVEDYSVANSRGMISVLEPTPDGGWSPARAVLQREHHLSYPLVFQRDGATYMIPETGEAGRIELYRAAAFPDSWELDRVLLDGLVAVDVTLHAEDGVLWLFANVADGPADRGELCLYSSPSLDGPWTAHPANPIVSDPGTARPAGRLFRRQGRLIRPGQDCSRRYGRAVVLNEVEVISPTEYRERPVGRIEPNWLPNLVGTHTYTFDSLYECLDAIASVRRLRVRRR